MVITFLKWFHFIFLIIKQTKCTSFSNLFCKETLHISDSSSVHHQKFFTVHTAIVCHTGFQTAHEKDQVSAFMTYTIAVCTVKNSWWWTEKLSETCRVSFQNKSEIGVSSWFNYKKFVTMHGHMNVKFIL